MIFNRDNICHRSINKKINKSSLDKYKKIQQNSGEKLIFITIFQMISPYYKKDFDILSEGRARRKKSKSEMKLEKLKSIKHRIQSVRRKFEELERDEEKDRHIFMKLVGVSNQIEDKAACNIERCQIIIQKRTKSVSPSKKSEERKCSLKRQKISEKRKIKEKNIRVQKIKVIKGKSEQKEQIQNYTSGMLAGILLVLMIFANSL